MQVQINKRVKGRRFTLIFILVQIKRSYV